MKLMRIHYVFMAAAMVLFGCGTTPKAVNAEAKKSCSGKSKTKKTEAKAVAAEKATQTVQYLKGQAVTTSPDGKIPYGPPVVVVAKRTIEKDRIVEDTWHGAEGHKTTATLRAGTLVFDVTDDKKSFSGTMTFAKEDWLSGAVTYDIKMLNQSGTLTGTGTWADGTYTTSKVFADPSGAPKAKIAETLKVITEAEFSAALPK